MIAILLKWLSGGIIGQLTGPLERAYKARLDAQTDEARLKADVHIRTLEAELEARKNARETIIAMRGEWMPKIIALPFAMHLWAVCLDTTFQFGWGVPKLPPPFDEAAWTILMSYFGLSGAGLVARAFSRRR